MDLALNNLQRLICHKTKQTKPNQTNQPIDRALSSTTILGKIDLGAMAMKRALRISQSSSITGTSPSDCLVSYLGHSLGGVLPLCREAVGVFSSPSRLGNPFFSLWYDSTWD